ncbi:MAG: beta-ketoacyl-ACP synthase II [Gemmatimonadota bacterium]
MTKTNGDPNHRVVVTGLGMVCPVGNDVESAWESLLAGKSGGGPVTLFETHDDFATRIACEVKGFEPDLYLDRKEQKRYDRFAQLGIAAVHQAMEWSGLDDDLERIDPVRFGVIFGSGIGGMRTFEEQCRILIEKGPSRVSPFFIPMFIPDIVAGLISMRYNAQGPNFATVSACASSAHAIGDAFRSIQRRETDLVLAGGTEAAVTALSFAGFSSMKAMSTRNDDPGGASRPFDANRDGFVMGEGAGALVLESLAHAEARGAEPLAEIVGCGLSADAYHITSPAPEGKGAQIAMRLAMEEAGASPGEVDYINAHGTSTPQNDATETRAVKSVFGDSAYDLVMGSTKSMTGHLLGAAGGVEAVICALALRDGKIPPTINFSEPDPECDLEYAHDSMAERKVELALSNSFGFGGHNVCLAMRRWSGS